MSFLHPEFLYFMLPPFLVLFVLLFTQKPKQLQIFSDEILDKLRVSSSKLTQKARNALFFFSGFFIIIALSQPVTNKQELEVKTKIAKLVIALDISDSMLAQDVYPDRLGFAKKKIMDFMSLEQNKAIGVMAFAKDAYLVSPISQDISAVKFLLKNLDTNSITEQGTDILSMLKVANRYMRDEKKKYLLVFSDGGDESDFSKEIKYAKDNNIVVFVMGIGDKKGSPIPKADGGFVVYDGKIVISKLNDSISKLATSTGGVYIKSVLSNKDIKAMNTQIDKKIKMRFDKNKKITTYTQLFYYPLLLSLIFLLFALSSLPKKVPLLSVLILLLPLHAKGFEFGFTTLDKAKKAYNEKQYKKSAQLFEKYAKDYDSAEAYYDSANAYYKTKDYKKALQNYKKARFDDAKKEAKRLANLGNTYAKMGKIENGIKSYEKSLKLQEDKDVRENLKILKKLLKKQKQKDNSKKQNKKQKNKQKNKQNSSKKNSKNKQKQQQKQQQQDKHKEKQANKDKSDMSEKEEAKWLKELNKDKKTFMYRLNKNSKYGGGDVKPW